MLVASFALSRPTHGPAGGGKVLRGGTGTGEVWKLVEEEVQAVGNEHIWGTLGVNQMSWYVHRLHICGDAEHYPLRR